MSLNPRDYDLDELRKMARKRGGHTNGAEAGSPDLGLESAESNGADVKPGGAYRKGLYRELLPLEAGGEQASKPYLETLPVEYTGEKLVFEWLEFLLLHAGYQGATEALSYYGSIGWITEDVESTLGDYLLGIDNQDAAGATDLDVEDHMLSLVYLAKLASMN